MYAAERHGAGRSTLFRRRWAAWGQRPCGRAGGWGHARLGLGRALLPPRLLLRKDVGLLVGPLVEGGRGVFLWSVLRGQPVVALPVAPVIALVVSLIVALPETLIVALIITLTIALTAVAWPGGAVGPGGAAGVRIAVEIGVLLPVIARASRLVAGPLGRIGWPSAAGAGAVLRALVSIMRASIRAWGRPLIWAVMRSRAGFAGAGKAGIRAAGSGNARRNAAPLPARAIAAVRRHPRGYIDGACPLLGLLRRRWRRYRGDNVAVAIAPGVALPPAFQPFRLKVPRAPYLCAALLSRRRLVVSLSGRQRCARAQGPQAGTKAQQAYGKYIFHGCPHLGNRCAGCGAVRLLAEGGRMLSRVRFWSRCKQVLCL